MRAILITIILSLMITMLVLALSLAVGFMFYLFESVWIVSSILFVCVLPCCYILAIKLQNMD